MKNKERIINAFARLLYNLKRIGVVVTTICGLLFIEGATDAEGITSSEEGGYV